mgnify:CR=1 FL=1
MLKILSYELCEKVIRACSQMHGAAAFEADHHLARLRTDAQAFTLTAGTSEVMRDILAKLLRI